AARTRRPQPIVRRERAAGRLGRALDRSCTSCLWRGPTGRAQDAAWRDSTHTGSSHFARFRPIVGVGLCRYVSVPFPNLGGLGLGARIQIRGRLVVQIEDRRVEEALPGRQGVLLLAYLAANRDRPVSRDELIEALWPDELPPRPESALSVLLSKLRSALGPAS